MELGHRAVILERVQPRLQRLAVGLELADAGKGRLGRLSLGEGVNQPFFLRAQRIDLFCEVDALLSARARQFAPFAAIGFHAQPDRLGTEQAGSSRAQHAFFNLGRLDVANARTCGLALVLARAARIAGRVGPGDHQRTAAAAALEQAGQGALGARGFGRLADLALRFGSVDRVAEIFGQDSPVLRRSADPVALGIGDHAGLAADGIFHLALAVPDLLAAIHGIPQDAVEALGLAEDRGGLPESPGRAGHARCVECGRNGLGR
ncbi:hypothetical protein [Oceanicaulis sp.]|uniref:hypothetical protein n=1 Tax=uncultured Oceanicaulis sp. TaxID=259940 RepID=UPI0025E6E5FC|nr:hypothetical protein [Oceanicaulis sp.]